MYFLLLHYFQADGCLPLASHIVSCTSWHTSTLWSFLLLFHCALLCYMSMQVISSLLLKWITLPRVILYTDEWMVWEAQGWRPAWEQCWWGEGNGSQQRLVDGALRKSQGEHWHMRWALRAGKKCNRLRCGKDKCESRSNSSDMLGEIRSIGFLWPHNTLPQSLVASGDIYDPAVSVGQEAGIKASNFRRPPPGASCSEDGMDWSRSAWQDATIIADNLTCLAEKLGKVGIDVRTAGASGRPLSRRMTWQLSL